MDNLITIRQYGRKRAMVAIRSSMAKIAIGWGDSTKQYEGDFCRGENNRIGPCRISWAHSFEEENF